MSDITLHGYVSGRVQAVGFRAFTRRAALNRGVSGGARNLADGRVEFTLSGNREAIEQVANEIQRGPTLAKVTHYDAVETAFEELDGFKIS